MVGFLTRVSLVFICVLLLACGKSGNSDSRSSVSQSSTSSTGSVGPDVTLSGRVTYDRVPYKTTLIGLNYNAVEVLPGRGLVVELLDQNHQSLSITMTDADGNYSFTAPSQTQVRVRVRAQLLSTLAPSWDLSVRDNTNNNLRYVMDGALVSTGSSNSIRNLHAASGWTGNSYGNPRVAAPFAILDSIYIALNRFVSAGYQGSFPELDIFWSVNNKAASGDPRLGEIRSSHYEDGAVYILGDANADTDEYDPYVIVHEWGHYIQSLLSRTDTTGGRHSTEVKLDMRLAMAEGFSNALPAMIFNNPLYRDSFGVRQSTGVYLDVSDKNPTHKGWYSEASVWSIIYNYYISADNKTARNFSDVLTGITADMFVQSESAISIFTFADAVKSLYPAHSATMASLLAEQNIFGTDSFGANETNNGGMPDALPIYKTLTPGGAEVQVCSSNVNGNYNKLGVHQFLSLAVINNGNYQVRVLRSSGQGLITNPDVEIFNRGLRVAEGKSTTNNSEIFSVNLSPGNYLLVIADSNNYNSDLFTDRRACFDVRVQTN